MTCWSGFDALNLPEVLRGLRAVEVPQGLGTPEARQVLQTLAEVLPRPASRARPRRQGSAGRSSEIHRRLVLLE